MDTDGEREIWSKGEVMEGRIEEYLRVERGVTSEIVQRRLCEKVMKYDDIAKEFVEWLETRRYDKNGLEIVGWTAEKIYQKAPQLDGIGVFNFLVTLRDSPEEAKQMIDEDFVVR